MIKFAPLNVPLERRIQTVGTLFWTGLLPLSIVLWGILLYSHYTRALTLGYMVWVFFWDDAPETGGRKSDLFRRLFVWKWMRDFFPISLEKEVDLDPKHNYVFGYHPHGVVSIGAWINFGTEVTGWQALFPKIQVRLLTLLSNFNIFIFREILLWMGMASVSKRSIENIFQEGPGHSVAIIIGGADEALYAKPGTMNLILKKRLGFIKMAILNKAMLVPVISFGENDVYDLILTLKGSWSWSFQQWCKRTWGWTMPAYLGRGIFNYSMGVLPHRVPIRTIIGIPIDPENVWNQALNPAQMSDTEFDECVLKVQQAYMDQLMDMYNRYKDKYAPDRTQDMQFVE